MTDSYTSPGRLYVLTKYGLEIFELSTEKNTAHRHLEEHTGKIVSMFSTFTRPSFLLGNILSKTEERKHVCEYLYTASDDDTVRLWDCGGGGDGGGGDGGI